MDNRERKQLWTRVAKGEITEKEAQDIEKVKKTPQKRSQAQKTKGKKKDAHKRKKSNGKK